MPDEDVPTINVQVHIEVPIVDRLDTFGRVTRRNRKQSINWLLERGLDAEAVRMASESAPGSVTK